MLQPPDSDPVLMAWACRYSAVRALPAFQPTLLSDAVGLEDILIRLLRITGDFRSCLSAIRRESILQAGRSNGATYLDEFVVFQVEPCQ